MTALQMTYLMLEHGQGSGVCMWTERGHGGWSVHMRVHLQGPDGAGQPQAVAVLSGAGLSASTCVGALSVYTHQGRQLIQMGDMLVDKE